MIWHDVTRIDGSSQDTTVELTTRDDCFLIDVYHLLLEIKLDGRIVDKVNLLARESTPGVWDADKITSV
jgi:hypothetical protein